jgi:hypothetical protein
LKGERENWIRRGELQPNEPRTLITGRFPMRNIITLPADDRWGDTGGAIIGQFTSGLIRLFVVMISVPAGDPVDVERSR